MNRFSGVIIIIAVPLFFFLALSETSRDIFPFFFNPEKPAISIGTVPMRVEVFAHHGDRVQGLSGRESLPETEGALFVFDESNYHGIWMRDMRFALDIIWIDSEFKIIDIEEDVTPSTFPKIFEPRSPAHFVLEVNSGYVESFGIEIGDRVTLPKRILPKDLRQN